MKEFDKAVHAHAGDSTVIERPDAFHLYDTYGFPIEITVEMARRAGLTVDEEGFDEHFREHQALPRGRGAALQGRPGGHSEETAACTPPRTCCTRRCARCWATRSRQRGSNITAGTPALRLLLPRKVTKDELKEVERLVNEAIAAGVTSPARR